MINLLHDEKGKIVTKSSWPHGLHTDEWRKIDLPAKATVSKTDESQQWCAVEALRDYTRFVFRYWTSNSLRKQSIQLVSYQLGVVVSREKIKVGVVSQCGVDLSAIVLMLSNLLSNRFILFKLRLSIRWVAKEEVDTKKGYLDQS